MDSFDWLGRQLTMQLGLGSRQSGKQYTVSGGVGSFWVYRIYLRKLVSHPGKYSFLVFIM